MYSLDLKLVSPHIPTMQVYHTRLVSHLYMHVYIVPQLEMGNQTKSDDENKNIATKTKKKRTENCYFSPNLCLPGVSHPVLDLPCMRLHCCCLHSSFKIKSCTNQNPLKSCKVILDPMVPNFAHFFRLHSNWRMKHRLQHKKKIDIALETSWPKT
jgi:hypothetical protein